MSQTPAALDELIAATREGSRFYSEAIAQLDDPHLKSVFRAIVDGKDRLAAALSEQVSPRGATPTAATLRGSLRRSYADVLARHGGGDSAGIARLELVEERLIDALENAAANAGDASLRRAIVRHLPRLRLCHEEMHNLRTRLAA
jgi:uncharacterized protein (TIGR02284 family)